MQTNSRLFNRFLAVAARGALATMCMYLIMNMSAKFGNSERDIPQEPAKSTVKKQVKDPVFPAVQTGMVKLQHDTMYVSADEFAKRKAYKRGYYNFFTNVAKLRIFVNKYADASSAAIQYLDDFNRGNNQTAYHELRHARNICLMGLVDDIDSHFMIADEFWARAAGGLADRLGLAIPRQGEYQANLNYTCRMFYCLDEQRLVYDNDSHLLKPVRTAGCVDPYIQSIADNAIGTAIKDLSHNFKIYAGCIFNISDTSKKMYKKSASQFKHKKIDRETALDSMSIFRINGRDVSLPAIASPDMQARLDTFFNDFAPRMMERYANKNGR